MFISISGEKDPMNCNYAQDYIYKGIAHFDSDGNKCRLRHASDVARVILAQAKGWDRRLCELKEELAKKKLPFEFCKLKFDSHLLVDEFIDNVVVVSKDAVELEGPCTRNTLPTTDWIDIFFTHDFATFDTSGLLSKGPKRGKFRLATWPWNSDKSYEMGTSNWCLVKIPTTREPSEIATYQALKFRRRTRITPLSGPFERVSKISKAELNLGILSMYLSWASANMICQDPRSVQTFSRLVIVVSICHLY